MPIRIVINGAFGNMGAISSKTLKSHSDFDVIADLGHKDDLKKTLFELKPDVVLDFTNAASVLQNTHAIIESGARPVIGTSGLTQNDVTQFKARCHELKRGALIVPNFSIGAVLMMVHAKAMASFYPNVEIIEMHHNKKQDSPSGTAVRTAELIAANLQSSQPTSTVEKQTIKGARGARYQNIPIHSVRLPGLVAHQQVIFGSQGETLTLRHDSINRECFMPGLIKACQSVMQLNHLVYGLESILLKEQP